MAFISTRGAAPPVGFAAALTDALAPDGGLYVPDRWPALSPAALRAMADMDYADVAARVVGALIQDAVAPDRLAVLCRAAYGRFADPVVAPLRPLDDGLHLLELFHGPTLAFKDFALQLLGELLGDVLADDRARGLPPLTLIGATSGDTGSAAIAGVAGRAGLSLFMLHPQGRISDVQRRQMTCASAANIHNIAVEGSFDDAQRIVKTLLHDPALTARLRLGVVNSINWLRVAAQAAYYVHAATRLGAPDRAVAFAVPTGNFGDAFAGYAALRLGVPVARIIAATNANDIVHRAIAEGVYARGALTATDAPAMDIQVASNFERLLFEASGRDGAALAAQMAAFAESGRIVLTDAQRAAIAPYLASARVDAEPMRETMRWAAARGVTLDPHSAIGVAAARAWREEGVPMVALATAHPAKFPDALVRAGIAPAEPPARLAAQLAGEERCTVLPADAAAVRAHILANAG